MDADGEDLTDDEVYERDVGWLMQSDIVIAEVTNASTGVGYELGVAEENGKAVHCLFREGHSNRMSPMVSGNDSVTVYRYEEKSEIPELTSEILG